jgi:hypothetical protein
MTANSAKPADGRFLHTILAVLIVAALTAGAVTAISIAKSEEPGPAMGPNMGLNIGKATVASQL